MSKKSAKADAKADTKAVDDSESELMLDSKTMDVLTEKNISAIMPTFQLMLKAAIAELRQEIKLEMDDKMKTLCAEKFDLRCGRMGENFKKLSSENSALRNQLLVLESSQSRTSLLIHGMPENTETTQQPDGYLTVKPTNIQAVVGQRVQFNCSTSEPYYVLWDHASVGSTSRSYIFFSGVLVLPYSHRLQLDRNKATGVYNLVIPSVQKEDAGNYRCMDMVGHGEQAEAELVVLDSSPQCETDDIQFCKETSQDFLTSCTVGYRGNLVPEIECSSDGVTTSSSTENSRTGNSVTYNLQLTAHWPLDDRHPIVCRTSISHVSSFVRPKVMYAYESTEMLNMDVHNMDSLDCKANSSEHCSYLWIHKDTSAVIFTSQTLTLREAGQYVCKATCILRGQTCVVTPLVVNLATAEDIVQSEMSAVHSDTTSIGLIVGVSLGIFLIVAGAGALVIVCMVRKGCRTRSSDRVATKTSEPLID